MSDPVRLSSGDGSELERELLESLRDVSPRGDEKARAWSGIAAQLAAATAIAAGTVATSSAAAAESSGLASGSAATGGAAGGAGIAPAGKSLLLAKWVLVAAAVGGTAGAGYWLKQSMAPSERTNSATSVDARGVPVPPAPSAVIAPRELAPPASVEVAPVAPRPVSPSVRPSPSEKRSEGKLSEQLAAESALLTDARARVRAGDLAGADAVLERLRKEFPGGVLSQEREVLAIELLAARGKTGPAQKRAQEFLDAHPKSPHNERVRRFLSP